MTEQKRDQILEKVGDLLSIDPIEVIAELNPEMELETYQVKERNLSEISALWKRSLKQLQNELKGPEYFILEDALQSHPITGSAFNVLSALNGMENNLNANKLANMVQLLSNLIQYEVYYGFWDKSKTKYHSTDHFLIDKLKSDLSLQIEISKNLHKKREESEEQYKAWKSEVESFVESKKKELDGLSSTLAESRSKREEINELLIQSNTIKSKIETNRESIAKDLAESKTTISQLRTQLQTELDSFSEKIQDASKKFQETKKDQKTFLSDLENRIDSFDEKLKFIQDQEEFINDKRDELIKLTGFAADTVLAQSFDKRAKKLDKSVRLWRNISAGAAVLTAVWIFLLITNFCQDFNIQPSWDAFILNFFKTSPFFIALGFSLAQYSKERTLLEEYEFKTAVSLTINPYADKLDDLEANAIKQKLIVDSITSVYSKPSVLSKNTKTESNENLLNELRKLLMNSSSDR